MQDGMYTIFTDSTGDFTPELVEELDIRVLPMAFTLDDKTYRNYPDNHDLDPQVYYNRLRAGGTSVTSSLNTTELEEALATALEAGQDVLYLAFSSGLSGTYQNGCIAAENLRERFPGRKIECFDTLNASMGEAMVVYLAAKRRLDGMSMDDLVAWLTQNVQTVNSWFTVNDLMFLKRGGRLSGGAAIAGTLLSIKPVLHVDAEGHLIAMEKVRGRKASIESLAAHYAKHASDKGNNVAMIGHGDCLEEAEALAEKLREAGCGKIYIGTIGPVIGAHSGPGTIALFYLGDER